MKYKYTKLMLLILVITVQSTFSQVFFERAFLTEKTPYSSKMAALGGNNAPDAGNPLMGMLNPALIITNDDSKLQIYANMKGMQTREMRTFPVLDSFDSFLADNIYVQNNTFKMDYNVGVRYTTPFVTVALGHYTVNNLEYTYSEEVRGSLYSVYNRDPLAGYHSVEFTGNISAWNLAIAKNFFNKLNLGIAYTLLNGDNLSDGYGVTVLGATTDGLASDTTTFFPKEYGMNSAGELVFGIEYHVNKRLSLNGGFTFRSDYEFTDMTLDMGREFNTGLPEYTVLPDSSKYNLTISRPFKHTFGLHYRTENILPTDIYLQVDLISWESYENSVSDSNSVIPTKNTWSFHAGIAHQFFTGVPFRVGFSYIPSPINGSLNKSILSFGSGFHRDMVELDFGVDFTEFSYSYPDLFPIRGEARTSLDTVKEQNINYYLTLNIIL